MPLPRRPDSRFPLFWTGGLLLACAGLAALQYRWTGDFGRIESERLRTDLDRQLHAFASNFDRELSRAASDFVPTPVDFPALGPLPAARAQAQRALARQSRSYFRAVAIALPNAQGQLELFLLSRNPLDFRASPWPPAWQSLRLAMQNILEGGRFPNHLVDPLTDLVEIPLLKQHFGPPQPSLPRPLGRAPELGWMIFDPDLDEIRRWLPTLLRLHLNTDVAVGIFRHANPSVSLFESPAGFRAHLPPVARAEFLPTHISDDRLERRPPPPGERKKKGPPPNRGRQYRWIVEARFIDGSVSDLVSQAQNRNLFIAAVLLLLILASGLMLIRTTYRARELADLQLSFLAGVSHELRTPLTVILGAGHNLLSGVVADEAQREKYLRAIVTNASQLSEMFEQLLTYAGSKQATPAPPRLVSLADALNDALESAAFELEAAQASVDVDFPPDLPSVWAEPSALRRVFVNLLTNGAKHGGGKIQVGAALLLGPQLEVRISDSGPGIPAAELPLLFDPFFRGQQARAGKVRGAGLGLSLVKQMLEANGASISVESPPGSGAAFILRLPTQAPPSGSQA